MELRNLFYELNGAFGPSGDEREVCALIRRLAMPYADEIKTDVLGNLIVHRRGDGPKLMISAHMDSVGFVVTHITDEGYLRCGLLGNINVKGALYAPVRFRNGTRGVFVKEEKAEFDRLNIDGCLIDIGAGNRSQAERAIRLGDTAVFDTPAHSGGGSTVIAPCVGDRIGCAVLLSVLFRAKNVQNDVFFVFTSQEEVGHRGAKAAAFAIQPDYGLVVDVTNTCDIPGGEALGSARLGGGAAIKLMDRSVICHSRMVTLLERLAGDRGIPAQKDLIDGVGTEAGVIHTTGPGVLTGGISIPCRYIHTPSEVADLDDAEQSVRLTSALVETRLDQI